jgi:AcrR family transcriptional regulator
MSDPVNTRPYDTSRRAERTQATKRAVVAAAHELFLARGFADTTVEAISTASRVPIATVYRLFKTKTAILKQVIDEAIVGDDTPIPLGDRSVVNDAQATEDPKAMAAAFAHVARQVFDNTAALRLVLRVAAAVDADATALQDSIEEQRRIGQARVARAFASNAFLRRGMKEAEARAIVYALMSIDTYRILRFEEHWSGARYERWLAEALYRLLVAPFEV